MTQIVTGYKRSLKIVVNKTIDGILAAGYPKYYPTALDVLNGYFTLNGINYSIPSQEQLGLMEQSEYDVLLLRFKQYVSLHEPDLSFSSDFINLPEVYAPDECYQITTTTTEHETTTTTEHEIPTDPIDEGYWNTDSFVFEVRTTGVNEQVALPLNTGYTYNFKVGWGDASSDTITAWDNAAVTHTYATAGTYTIIIQGICQSFYCNNTAPIRTKILRVINWGEVDFRRLNFHGCTNLASIPNAPITGVANLPNFNSTFYNCTSLKQSIPVGLFNNAVNVSTSGFLQTFRGCSGLTGAIPSGLFDNNPLVSTFGFTQTFRGCSGLTGAIPAGLFANNTAVSTDGFSLTFQGCSGLTGAIPAGLFANNPLVSSGGFSGTFYNCSGLTGAIPAGLFDNNPLVSTGGFLQTFYNCSGLTGIPANLYTNCPNVTSYAYCHFGNTGITSAVPELWNLTPQPTGTQCFWNCTNASNYADIPADWK